MGVEAAPLRRTPLYEAAIAASGRMVPFGGWEMPVQFEGIGVEHKAVREQAGLFDISHMGQFLLAGESAAEFLDYLLPGRISRLLIGQMLYAPMCNEEGGCIDDAVVYRLAQHEFLLVVNASRIYDDWHWIARWATGKTRLQIDNLSDKKAMLALQGPEARRIVTTIAGAEVGDLRYYHCMQAEIEGADVLVSRNGYTGEDGFEIICDVGRANDLWSHFIATGALPCGLGARDTLRTEMGFCLYGHELTEEVSPLQAGLGWTIDWDKHFIGAKALSDQRKKGDYRRLRGFRLLERGIPRPDYLVVDGQGKAIGKVTSGTHSPTLKQGIGLAYLDRGAAKLGTQIHIDMRGKKRLAEVVRLPFVPSRVKRVN